MNCFLLANSGQYLLQKFGVSSGSFTRRIGLAYRFIPVEAEDYLKERGITVKRKPKKEKTEDSEIPGAYDEYDDYDIDSILEDYGLNEDDPYLNFMF